MTNPVWRQFLDLFYLVDKGHPGSKIEHGYNGGLFAHDPEVDDLQLKDDWTTIFTEIAGYDFQHEVSVDVLGHIFERSLNEVQRARIAGLFGPTSTQAEKSKMQKSPERKRSGTYYTPPEFTQFIVENTVIELIRNQLADVAETYTRRDFSPPSTPPAPFRPTHPDNLGPEIRAAYHRDCLQAIRKFKIIDPACGSGAFLIAAFDALEELYYEQINIILATGDASAQQLIGEIPNGAFEKPCLKSRPGFKRLLRRAEGGDSIFFFSAARPFNAPGARNPRLGSCCAAQAHAPS